MSMKKEIKNVIAIKDFNDISKSGKGDLLCYETGQKNGLFKFTNKSEGKTYFSLMSEMEFLESTKPIPCDCIKKMKVLVSSLYECESDKINMESSVRGLPILIFYKDFKENKTFIECAHCPFCGQKYEE